VTNFSLERRELTEENFDEVYGELVGQYAKAVEGPLSLAGSGSPAGESGTLALTTKEADEISLLTAAMYLTMFSTAFHSLAATLTPIPDPKADLHYWGLGGTIDLKVGTVLSNVRRCVRHRGRLKPRPSEYYFA